MEQIEREKVSKRKRQKREGEKIERDKTGQREKRKR